MICYSETKHLKTCCVIIFSVIISLVLYLSQMDIKLALAYRIGLTFAPSKNQYYPHGYSLWNGNNLKITKFYDNENQNLKDNTTNIPEATYFIPYPEKSFTRSSDRRITACYELQSHRLGNQLFVFASTYGVARKNGITPTFKINPNQTEKHLLHKIFEAPVIRDPMSSFKNWNTHGDKGFGKYDKRTANLTHMYSGNICLSLYLQSWKYFREFEHELRQQLRLMPEVRKRAEDYLKSFIPEKFRSKEYIRVGMHVRRGDMTWADKIRVGYQTASSQYFFNAMEHFKKKYNKVIFVVCSNDLKWSKKYINSTKYNVFYSETKDPYLDFTTLSIMNHMIMSVGTFGWWAAWVANGTTVYYKYSYKQGSELYKHYSSDDFFPQEWIAMT